jgi:hypothetical protein
MCPSRNWFRGWCCWYCWRSRLHTINGRVVCEVLGERGVVRLHMLCCSLLGNFDMPHTGHTHRLERYSLFQRPWHKKNVCYLASLLPSFSPRHGNRRDAQLLCQERPTSMAHSDINDLAIQLVHVGKMGSYDAGWLVGTRRKTRRVHNISRGKQFPGTVSR